ncbi:MAG: NAD(P)/FAD-dependent oxidoreductase [Roseiflexaceae bacterium]
MHDLIIIGAGPIGSGAARHASMQGRSVTVIAPHEAPRDTHIVWSSHYDQGRITHRSARNMTLAHWANEAIAEYRTIEAQSGIAFYHPCGTLTLSASSEGFSYTQQRHQLEHDLAFQYEELTPSKLSQRFLMLSNDLPYHGLYDGPPSGVINPRRYVAAQLACAANHGATHINDVVTSLQPHHEYVALKTHSGHEYAAQQVIIAAGAYSGLYGLLPSPIDHTVKSEIVTLGEVSAKTAATLADMPSMMVDCVSPIIEDAYLTPPIHYPDGKWYIKLGSNSIYDQFFDDHTTLTQWIRSGDRTATHHAQIALLKELFANIEWQSFTSLPCVITRTSSGVPQITRVHPRVTAVVGCNGSLAKSGSVVGKLAVQMMQS